MDPRRINFASHTLHACIYICTEVISLKLLFLIHFLFISIRGFMQNILQVRSTIDYGELYTQWVLFFCTGVFTKKKEEVSYSNKKSTGVVSNEKKQKKCIRSYFSFVLTLPNEFIVLFLSIGKRQVWKLETPLQFHKCIKIIVNNFVSKKNK